MKSKLFRITTVPESLKILLKGQLRYMNSYFEVVGVSTPLKELNEVTENEGIRVVPLEMKRQVNLWKDAVGLVKMYCLIKREKPDIIHTHTPKAGMLGMIAGWMARVPVRLHTVAGLPLMEAHGIKRTILNIIEKLTYACATKVYPNSHGLLDYILRQKICSPDKVKVIGNGSSNGIDTGHFSLEQISDVTKDKLKESLKIKPGDFVFIFVGRLVKDKGINELVSAFTEIKNGEERINPLARSAKLVLVGYQEKELDPLHPATLEAIDKNRDIVAVGYQPDVRPYYSIADALVFPSYREGLPNVPMQAGAMGLPSIVTDINGCNEIVIQGVNGLIIPPKDEKALFIAMRWFVENPEEVVRMAKSSRDLIVSRYEQKHVWEALLKEYQRMETEILTP